MSPEACLEGGSSTPPVSRWRRWFLDPIFGQLRQGITPEKIALTIALGVVIGVFPVMGATTVLCTAVGYVLRLNQPILQTINYLLYPLQIALILVFVRIGEWLFRVPPLPFSFNQLMEKFRASPGHFFREFGSTFLHGITAWLLLAPGAVLALYYTLRPILKRASARA